MKTHHLIIAAGFALFALTAFALTGLGKLPSAVAEARGDRLDVIEQAQRCAGTSMMAACADSAASDAALARNGSVIQVFEQPGTTILVKTRIGS